MFVISQLWVRLLGTILFSAGLVFFACPFLVGIRHAGCIFGTVISVMGIVFFALNPAVSGILQKIWENGFGHFVLCILMGILGFGAVLGIVMSVFMIISANHKPKSENTVVILGCKVRDGAPSLMLQKRLDAALNYLNQHPDVPVIVCGGQGEDESITEAQCMTEYLTAHGLAESRIYRDDTSTSTLENLQNAKAIITEQDWLPEITIVTDGYHQFRAANIAKSIGLSADAVSAGTSWYLVPSYWVREWLGICYQFVFG
ncbi:MAG: YdcF family protein [Oscillospiraceae bacterium]|nr:YdcF family protein [Oscillospiraceae bacterium]